ncbi:MAG TPA: TIGR02147 family protein, partial [Chitinispirillaceae bacterium]|nr:TIGR02147 family protein [Chitinispirillaceae bacterium]
HYFEKLLAFSEISEKQIDSTNYEFYQHWYYTAVREILNFIDFKDDYQLLSELVNPPISVSEAKKSVKLLCNLGMIKQDDQGIYRLTEKFVTTGVQWQSIAIRSYQKEACGLAAEAIDKTPKELRDISTVTVSINKEGVKRISEVLSRVRHELIEIAASCEKVDRAYQVNLQLFPVSKITEERQEGCDK